jgi:hypothetical protein
MKAPDLKSLLRETDPRLEDGRFFMASVAESNTMALAGYLQYILCIYRESDGLSVVFWEDMKDVAASLTSEPITGPFALITLGSDSLTAAGLLAKVTEALAKGKISVNAFSAYHHDHLLVPYGRREDALALLKALQKR